AQQSRRRRRRDDLHVGIEREKQAAMIASRCTSTSVSGRLGLLLPPFFVRHPDALSGDPGSQIAGMNFCRAVLSHSGGRTVTLFVREEERGEFCQNLSCVSELTFDAGTRIAVCPVSSLGVAWQDSAFTALHDFRGPFLDRVAYTRSLIGGKLFPVTCTG